MEEGAIFALKIAMLNKIAETYFAGIIPQIMEKTTGGFAVAFLAAGCVLCALIGYFLGSFNFALILSKKMYGEDIRNYGSKNAGTTNMMRTYGKKAAAFTIIGDILKGIVSVAIGCFAMGINLGGYLTGLFCVIGHIFPVFYGFKGGKGVATAAAVILMLNPFVFLCVIAVFLITVILSRYVSLGSVLAAAVFPLLTYSSLFAADTILPYRGFSFVFSFIMAVLVILKHKENLDRLAHGKENKFSFKSSKSKHKPSENSKPDTKTK